MLTFHCQNERLKIYCKPTAIFSLSRGSLVPLPAYSYKQWWASKLILWTLTKESFQSRFSYKKIANDRMITLLVLFVLFQQIILYRQCAKIRETMLALTEIQRMASQLEEERCSRDALRLHLQTMKFVSGYTKLFESPQALPKRKMFSTSYHSVVSHLADMYRIVSLTAIDPQSAVNTSQECK